MQTNIEGDRGLKKKKCSLLKELGVKYTTLHKTLLQEMKFHSLYQ